MICICFSLHLEAFLIVFKNILSTFCGFVVGVLSEAKKRKINTRDEGLLLKLLAKAKALTASAGEVISKANKEAIAMSRGANKGTSSRYSELQPVATSREGGFSIPIITHRSRRGSRYSMHRARRSETRKSQPTFM